MTRHEYLVKLTEWFLNEPSGAAENLGINSSELTLDILASASETDLFNLFRALVNVRPVLDTPDEILAMQDGFLRGEIARKGITDVNELNECMRQKLVLNGPECIVWQGDITTMKVDAIVNAANSALLGCWAPNHGCIDNAIHTYAGVQLRSECQRLMKEQGHDERTGSAKITAAFNLPSKFILHTVGPIVRGSLTLEDENLLASCYDSCLDLASSHSCQSIAFCCISTGEFHFPNRRAAEIAIQTTRLYFEHHAESPISRIVFNVFKDVDREIYIDILSGYHCNA